MQSTERGKKLNAAMQQTGKVVGKFKNGEENRLAISRKRKVDLNVCVL